MAGVLLVLYRYTPRRRINLADVWPAALATAVAWEASRRLLAVYFEHTSMISGYGPIGAAMALIFWIYVSCILILLGAELTYATAKERRGIGPREEIQIIAPPGEQPSPKFAPQVGAGFSDRNAREPIQAQAAPSPANDDWLRRSQPPGPTGAHSSNGSTARKLLWVALSSGSLAIVGIAAQQSLGALWKALTGEPPPSEQPAYVPHRGRQAW
jgi:hypothetical protein